MRRAQQIVVPITFLLGVFLLLADIRYLFMQPSNIALWVLGVVMLIVLVVLGWILPDFYRRTPTQQ